MLTAMRLLIAASVLLGVACLAIGVAGFRRPPSPELRRACITAITVGVLQTAGIVLYLAGIGGTLTLPAMAVAVVATLAVSTWLGAYSMRRTRRR